MKTKLLVVDDQMGVLKMLFEAFKDEGYQVELAGSGREAIDKVRREVPDIILMDVKMPGMNGLEVFREIRKFAETVPVVMMTAYGELEIVNEALLIGVKEYITKPFDINELREVIKRVIME